MVTTADIQNFIINISQLLPLKAEEFMLIQARLMTPMQLSITQMTTMLQATMF